MFNDDAHVQGKAEFKIAEYEEITKGYERGAELYEIFMKYTGIVKVKNNFD